MPSLSFRAFALNIRQKIILGIVVSLLGMGLLGSISYRLLVQIEETLRLAEVVDDLNNDILEVRRYEKNFLLYANPDDARETLAYVQKALDLVERIEPGQGQEAFARLRAELVTYRENFATLAPVPGRPKEGSALRELGKDLVATAQNIVLTQRERILHIVATLKGQLLLSICSLLGLGVLAAWFVGRKIVRALLLIERSTGEIVQGRFAPLPVPDARDETRSVVLAFNHMIEELDKRQNQLLQEKKLASLGVLTSGIAHQLNNPLNNISTSCQILREEAGEGGDPAFARRMLDNIHGEVIRSRDIVKGLLEFSRTSDFLLKPTVLADLLERTVALVSSDLPAGIEIVRQAPPDLILPLDAQRMQEAFLNLLMNAIQAIPGGQGRITVSAAADEAAGQAVLRFADTGAGIPQEQLGRIFDPFFTTKEVGRGTGLGLSIVFGIVKKHGGSVSVESQPGQGAVFTLRLPLAPKEDSAA
ncbi:MAG: ATP-binding protein [Thermodesulfobacteriota bacterium]